MLLRQLGRQRCRPRSEWRLLLHLSRQSCRTMRCRISHEPMVERDQPTSFAATASSLWYMGLHWMLDVRLPLFPSSAHDFLLLFGWAVIPWRLGHSPINRQSRVVWRLRSAQALATLLDTASAGWNMQANAGAAMRLIMRRRRRPKGIVIWCALGMRLVSMFPGDADKWAS
jgi:hypothetical protein